MGTSSKSSPSEILGLLITYTGIQKAAASGQPSFFFFFVLIYGFQIWQMLVIKVRIKDKGTIDFSLN